MSLSFSFSFPSVLFFVCGLGLLSVPGSPVPSVMEQHPHELAVSANRRLYYLGTSSDGKSYLMENVTTFDWGEAKKFCAGMGMELATIKTMAQAEFVNNKLPLLVGEASSKYYWLNGGQSFHLRMYEWNNADFERAQPIDNFGRDYVFGINAAVILVALQNSDSYFSLRNIFDKFGAICEL